MSDVLTPADIVKVMLAIRDAKPSPPVYYGPRWATDHLRLHEYRHDCADCQRAWRAIYR